MAMPLERVPCLISLLPLTALQSRTGRSPRLQFMALVKRALPEIRTGRRPDPTDYSVFQSRKHRDQEYGAHLHDALAALGDVAAPGRLPRSKSSRLGELVTSPSV